MLVLVPVVVCLVFVLILILWAESNNHPTAPLPLNASNDNSTLGLSLTLRLNSTQITQGQFVDIVASVTNDRASPNNMTAGLFKEGWLQGGELTDGCYYLANAAIFSGFYSIGNISGATHPLQLAEPTGRYSCPVRSEPWMSFFPFAPNETHIGFEFVASGYYSGYDAPTFFASFPVGAYTVVAGDTWGQLVVLHLEVHDSA
jgi:hypothetical protein